MTENKTHIGEIVPPNLDENCSKQKENVKFCMQLTLCYPKNEQYKIMFDREKQKYLKLLNEAKIKQNSERIINSDNKGKTTWSIINETTNVNNKGKTSKSIDEIRDKNDELKSDPLEIANIFNTFFSNIANNLKEQIPPNNFKHIIAQTNKSTIEFNITIEKKKKHLLTLIVEWNPHH